MHNNIISRYCWFTSMAISFAFYWHSMATRRPRPRLVLRLVDEPHHCGETGPSEGGAPWGQSSGSLLHSYGLWKMVSFMYSWFMLIYLFKMLIFHFRYVKLPEGKLIEVMASSSFNNGVKHGTPWCQLAWMLNLVVSWNSSKPRPFWFCAAISFGSVQPRLRWQFLHQLLRMGTAPVFHLSCEAFLHLGPFRGHPHQPQPKQLGRWVTGLPFGNTCILQGLCSFRFFPPVSSIDSLRNPPAASQVQRDYPRSAVTSWSRRRGIPDRSITQRPGNISKIPGRQPYIGMRPRHHRAVPARPFWGDLGRTCCTSAADPASSTAAGHRNRAWAAPWHIGYDRDEDNPQRWPEIWGKIPGGWMRWHIPASLLSLQLMVPLESAK